MIEQTAKIALGTVLYVAVLWVAQRNPRAAGMMLTFPTLNGIGLLMAAPAMLEPAAHAMLLMPILNGLLCAGYLAGFERLARADTAPATASALMIAAIAVVWLISTGLITQQRWGIPPDLQLAYALGVTVLGLALTLAIRPPQLDDHTAAAPPEPLAAVLHGNRRRIALFALSLAVVAAAERLEGSPAVLGVLASLPLVAFFGMHAIAGDSTTPLASRRHVLAAMARGVWLGPAVAIAFIAGLWRVLGELAQHRSGLDYIFAGAAALLAGWLLCIMAIWTSASLLRHLRPHRPPQRFP